MPAPRLRVVDKKEPPAAEYIDPKLLHPWKDNPRDNAEAVGPIKESIRTYGFGAPIVARRANREIIAGETRWKAAMEMRLARVPVRFLDINEEMAHQLAVADNRLGEISKWDLAKLHGVLNTFTTDDVSRAGWSDKEMRAVEKAARDAQPDNADKELPPPPKKPVTKPGDLWVLGKHRLVCGDATDAKQVKLACGGTNPFLMVTDPPYGVDYDATQRVPASRADFGGAKRATNKVANDTVSDWRPAYELFSGSTAYVWHAAMTSAVVTAGLSDSGLEPRQQIVWAKQHFALGRGSYQWKHELCWYAVRDGADALWCGDRDQTTVWEIQNANPMGGVRDEAETNHSTQKPLECMARPMRNHGRTGTVVYDPFCGSGTSIAAAESLERVCIALEISPACCDLVVARWEELSGGKARRPAL